MTVKSKIFFINLNTKSNSSTSDPQNSLSLCLSERSASLLQATAKA